MDVKAWFGLDAFYLPMPSNLDFKAIREYRTLEGLLINADCNGAANIGRKVAATLGLCLKEVGRGALKTPLRVPLWS